MLLNAQFQTRAQLNRMGQLLQKKTINMKTYGQDRVVAEISAWPQS